MDRMHDNVKSDGHPQVTGHNSELHSPEDVSESNNGKYQLSPKAKSRLLAAATLNKIGLMQRALTGKHKHEEETFKDEALIISVSFRHTDCCKLLIKHGANVNSKSNEGLSCLIIAVQQACHEIVKTLLEVKDCELNAVFEGDFNTSLHHAALNNDVTGVDMLVKAGCNPNLKNCKAETPLIIASERGYDEIVNALITGGADMYATKFNLRTAFHRAIEFGHFCCMKLFMDNGVDIHHTDSDGRCGLHMASDKGHTNIVKTLIKAGISPNVQDLEDQTALFEATSRGHIDCVMALVAAGSLAGVQNRWGNTPVMSAIIVGRVECLKLLLKLVTYNELNMVGFLKMSALHFAALYGNVDCTKLLLQCGADPNLQCTDSHTPAHLAVKGKIPQCSSILILQLLLQKNANFSTKGTFCNRNKKRYVTCFELALCLGMIDTSCWLALTDPNMRLVQLLFTDKIYRNTNILSEAPALEGVNITDPLVRWLITRASQPLTLAKLCRKVIRANIGVDIEGKLKEITLPTRLKDFLKFKDMCKDNSYWYHMRNSIIEGSIL